MWLAICAANSSYCHFVERTTHFSVQQKKPHPHLPKRRIVSSVPQRRKMRHAPQYQKRAGHATAGAQGRSSRTGWLLRSSWLAWSLEVTDEDSEENATLEGEEKVLSKKNTT
jgi:hypothetical protein